MKRYYKSMLSHLLSNPAPQLTPEQAQRMLVEHWNVAGSVVEIACERDQNFRVVTDTGDGFILKISNSFEKPGNTEFQSAALEHVARVDASLPIPRVVSARDGNAIQRLKLPSGETCMVRLLTWLKGETISKLGQETWIESEIGLLAARLGLALETFDHPEAEHQMLWDIKNLSQLHDLADAIEDPEIAQIVLHELDHFEVGVSPRLAHLRRQVIHNDLNHHNILANTNTKNRITGVLDFGDMVKTYLIIDVAVAASYLAHSSDPVRSIGRLVSSYHSVRPLEWSEVKVLRDLIVARLVAAIIISSWRAVRYPENAAYILRNAANVKDAIRTFGQLPRAQVTQALMAACEMEN